MFAANRGSFNYKYLYFDICKLTKYVIRRQPHVAEAALNLGKVVLIHVARCVCLLGDLIHICAGAPQKAHQRFYFGHVEQNYTPVYGHLAQVGRHVHSAGFGHLLPDHRQLRVIDPEADAAIAFASSLHLTVPVLRLWPQASAVSRRFAVSL